MAPGLESLGPPPPDPAIRRARGARPLKLRSPSPAVCDGVVVITQFSHHLVGVLTEQRCKRVDHQRLLAFHSLRCCFSVLRVSGRGIQD
jgi:hypothetical protein